MWGKGMGRGATTGQARDPALPGADGMWEKRWGAIEGDGGLLLLSGIGRSESQIRLIRAGRAVPTGWDGPSGTIIHWDGPVGRSG